MNFQIQTKQNIEVSSEQLGAKLEELKSSGAEIIRVIPIESTESTASE